MFKCKREINLLTSSQFEKRPDNVITMHAGKGLYTTQIQDKFYQLKPVLAFQTLTLAMLGKWATTHKRFFFLGQELLLDFAAWIDLTSNADNSILAAVAFEVTEHILLL